MESGDAAVTLEIRSVESEHTLDAIDSHDGHQPRVIDSDALHAMVPHDSFPGSVNRLECPATG
jgi:hypothetical protein